MADMLITIDITINVGIFRTCPVLKNLNRIGKKYVPAIINNINEINEKKNKGL